VAPAITILRSRRLSDAQNAVEAIRQRHCIPLLLDDAEPEEAQRIVDVLAGAVSALDGQVERIGECTFVFAPATADAPVVINGPVPQCLARLEAILTGVPGDRELRLVLEQLDPGSAGTFS